jgi:ABC-type multidrug transport system fused ATPase/permease subunit
MIFGLIRSPSKYFDVTPTGQLINKFANDLGILDNSLSMIFIDVIDGVIGSIVMLINIFQINIYFVPPGLISIVAVAIFFLLSKGAIIGTRQLDLIMKVPVFKMFGEMLMGLIQIRIFKRRPSLLS